MQRGRRKRIARFVRYANFANFAKSVMLERTEVTVPTNMTTVNCLIPRNSRVQSSFPSLPFVHLELTAALLLKVFQDFHHHVQLYNIS